MPPLEVGKKYYVEPKMAHLHMINANTIMNNPDIRKPPIAKYLGGKTFLFDSDTVALGVHTELKKQYWVFTPVDGGDPLAVDDKNDPQPLEGGRTRKRKSRKSRKSRRSRR